MINFYTTDKNKVFKQINNLENNCWIDIVNPAYEELEEIANKTNTDLDLLQVVQLRLLQLLNQQLRLPVLRRETHLQLKELLNLKRLV